jgi:hypothetical protein
VAEVRPEKGGDSAGPSASRAYANSGHRGGGARLPANASTAQAAAPVRARSLGPPHPLRDRQIPTVGRSGAVTTVIREAASVFEDVRIVPVDGIPFARVTRPRK